MSSWAKVGAKCVCVDDKPIPGMRWFGVPPVVGEIYVIEKICGPDRFFGRPSAIFRGLNQGGPIRLERFRPLVTRTQQQDVEMFKRLVHRVPSMDSAQ